MNINYRKLTISNFLNWFAVRLSNLCNNFCAKIILVAIYLNPERRVFKKNLINLRAKNKNLPITLSKKYHFKFFNVLEGCEFLSQKINIISSEQNIEIDAPIVLGSNSFKYQDKYQIKLPINYLVEVTSAEIIGCTDLIIVENHILYDEINKSNVSRYAIKSPVITNVSEDHITVRLPYKMSKNIDQGIHFCKDHSKNYFHWIVECLPRLSPVSGVDQDIPLLVDEDLPAQCMEALSLISDRQIIKISKNNRYKIEYLYYPSQLSIIHDNYGDPNYNEDVAYCARGLDFVRTSILKNLQIDNNAGNRKLYISRKNSDYRQLLNTNEIENVLIEHGFEIIFPENLSFISQVRLFSQAKVIIGQSGAGMANIVFAPKECHVLIMMSDVPQTNFQLFNAFGIALGMRIEFLAGKHIYVPKKYTIHADFYIDIGLLMTYLKDKNL